MLIDWLLASLHHVLFFALIAMLVAESVLLRGPVDAATIARLRRLDAGYGLSAVLVLVAGGLRIAYGIKGYDFYQANPWFHAKLGVFVLIGLLSIAPTLRFGRWSRALRDNPAFAPDPGEIARTRSQLRLQMLGIAVILVLAAATARHGGLL
jgi:putative membrane protein